MKTYANICKLAFVTDSRGIARYSYDSRQRLSKENHKFYRTTVIEILAAIPTIKELQTTSFFK